MLRYVAASNPALVFTVLIAMGIFIYSMDSLIKKLRYAERPYHKKQKMTIAFCILCWVISFALLIYAAVTFL